MNAGKLLVDKSKISTAVNSKIPLSVTSYTVPRAMERYMNDVLLEFLKALHLEYMAHYLIYCENELVTNAKKANTKRVYFAEKGLDIHNQDDYEKGMKTFKSDTLSNIGRYMELQKAARLYVKLVLSATDSRIVMEVRNNAEMTRLERRRIFDRIRRAQQYTSIEDAVLHVLDDSEGAGIGLIIMMLMLKKFGMTEDGFRVSNTRTETSVSVSIPISRAIQREEAIVAEEFEDIIQNLPQFPENISRLHQLCDDPDADLFTISRYISGDVAISGELLKRANSAALGAAKPCSSICDAVKLVGTHGIKNMLCSFASIQTFRTVSGGNVRLWRHAHTVAFFSYMMARSFCPGSTAASEDAFTGGLLHDMGKIIFEMARPQFLNHVKTLCAGRGVSPELFEKLVSGMNHGEIGAHIAEHWHFPAVLVDIIRWHHSPNDAPEGSRKLAAIVHLADIAAHGGFSREAFDRIDSAVLAEFKITEPSQFQKLAEGLHAGFESMFG